jgi:small subunit ribosomal protein S8
MYVNDPIADMLTRIRNAIMARKTVVEIPHSKMKVELARVLLEEGYIKNYSVREDNPFSWIVIDLKFVGERRDRRSVISGLKRVSKPGRRIYTGHQDIPWVLSGMGIAILTTPKGVMTGQRARKERVGGEVLCYIW